MLSEMQFPLTPAADPTYENLCKKLDVMSADFEELLWDIDMLERRIGRLTDEEEDRLCAHYNERKEIAAQISDLIVQKEVMETSLAK